MFLPGTMSGGGNRQIKGRMSSKLHSDVSPEELTSMEKMVQQNEEALAVRRLGSDKVHYVMEIHLWCL